MIGKVASSILIVAGVKEIYADTISELAIPILEQNNIKYEYNHKVEFIKNNEKTSICPMENKFKEGNNLKKYMIILSNKKFNEKTGCTLMLLS